MNTVVSDLQIALLDKKRNYFGLFDASLSLKTQSSKLGNTNTSIKKRWKDRNYCQMRMVFRTLH
jgi:hypothetical protein